MTKIEELGVYETAIQEYGIENQKWMVVEEVGELLNAIAKLRRGRAKEEDVIEELADVSIMCEQIAESIDYAAFLEVRERKIERLERRLNE